MPARYIANNRKALEVILWMAEKQDRIDFYHILKVLFYADMYHLNTYGRPIVGDTYDALNHGPVARTVYSILKKDALELQALDNDTQSSNGNVPFEVEDTYRVRGRRPCNRDLLSESDIEALELAFAKYGTKSFNELRRLTHDEAAYQIALEESGVLRYEDMLEDSDEKDKVAEDLRKIARHARF